MELFFIILGGALFVLGLLQFVGFALVILSWFNDWSPRTHAWIVRLFFVPFLAAVIVGRWRNYRSSWPLSTIVLVCVVGVVFLVLGLLLWALSR